MNNSVYSHNNKLLSLNMMSTYLKGPIQEQRQSSSINQKQSTLTIFNAFTGVKIVTSFNVFNNIESLKTYIAQSLSIDTDRLFLLTSFGIKLKFSMIVHEQVNEIFAFDRKFFNPALIKAEKSDLIIKDLLSTLKERDDITILMIKPRESPLLNTQIDSFINSILKSLENDSLINSSDLDFDNLRLLLNLLKRNSGWAVAILSDMKSSLFDNNTTSLEYQHTENILQSLNVLIQYISNLFTNLQKEFNTIVEVFINLSSNTLAYKWESQYELLEKISFAYFDKSSNKAKKLVLSELIDYNQMAESSENSKLLEKKINSYLVNMRKIIESDIFNMRKQITEEYESFKHLYLNPEWESSERDITNKAKKAYFQLEKVVNEMVAEMENIPSFEQLISTTNQLSTYLSIDAVGKIKKLISIYKSQLNVYVPKITELSNNLYSIQCRSTDTKNELQRKIVTSNLFSIVKIQLSLREASKIIESKLLKNIEILQNEELQLSIVLDLPLVFGLWDIAVLANIKYGISMLKISRKATEIFDMINFIEKNNRSNWLNEFVEGLGDKKMDLLFLKNIEYKDKFLSDNLDDYQILSSNTKGKALFPLITEKKQTDTNKRNNSDINSYLTPINKFIQNINNGFPNKLKSEPVLPVSLIDDDMMKNPQQIFFEGLIENITSKDILDYILILEKNNYDSNLIKQLKNYLETIGIKDYVGSANEYSKSDVVIKNGSTEKLGSFDVNDEHYMKIFEKFIKGFESKNIKINILKVDNEDLKEREKKMENNFENIGLIRSYEERIKKLESLLHEKKFWNFNSKWSQINDNTFKALEGDIEMANDTTIFENTDGLFGKRGIKLPPTHYFEQINNLTNENDLLKKEIEELKKSQTGEFIEDMKCKIKNDEGNIEKLKLKLADLSNVSNDKSEVISNLQNKIKELQFKNDNLIFENRKNNSDINELRMMNQDLLENMSNKEDELMKENQLNQKEKNDLMLKIEELVEFKTNYMSIREKLKETDDMIDHVLSILFFTFDKLREMSVLMYENMSTFCLILELMGLLLVKEGDNIDIKRVKGLRYTKKNIYQKMNGIIPDKNEMDEYSKNEDRDNEADFVDRLFLEVVASKLADESKGKIEWIPLKSFDDFKSDITDLMNGSSSTNDNKDDNDATSDRTEEMKHTETTIESLNNYDSKLKYIIEAYPEEKLEIKYHEFVESVTIKPELILDKIHRRFEEVEKLARKLQKEKIQFKNDLKMVSKKALNQLVIKNFQVGDLVLFLRTLTLSESMRHVQKNQPWAIFNIGSPNYYLNEKNGSNSKLLESKEWFVSRIKNIEKHVVTSESKDNIDENPFGLGVGTVWYFVETSQESLL